MAAKKAHLVLGMIKRNIECKNSDIIMRLYKSLIRPRLEYCIQAYNNKDFEVLERVQKLATKIVYECGELNYKDRLSLLKLPSLVERRVRRDLVETFKLLKDIDKLDFHTFLVIAYFVAKNFCRFCHHH